MLSGGHAELPAHPRPPHGTASSSAALEDPVSHGISTVTFCFLLHLAFALGPCVNQGSAPTPQLPQPPLGPFPPGAHLGLSPGLGWLQGTRWFGLHPLHPSGPALRGRAALQTSSAAPASLCCGSSGPRLLGCEMCRISGCWEPRGCWRCLFTPQKGLGQLLVLLGAVTSSQPLEPF